MLYNKLILNPYDKTRCQQIVKGKYEKLIHQKFGNYVHLCFEKNYKWTNNWLNSPRLRALTGQISCASFYYTEFLVELSPDSIYDIGCGMNFFKNILPNVVGIDRQFDYDIQDVFDKDFVSRHLDSFQAVMSIDALHFITLSDFLERVIDFSKIISPGGRGYLAMNAARMVECTDPKQLERLTGSIRADPNLIAGYIDNQIRELPLKFLVIENSISDVFDDSMDGNIRLVIQK